MIDRQDHPLGRYFLLDELSGAHERLGKLLQAVSVDPTSSVAGFRIDLVRIDPGRIHALLNRAWHRRHSQEGFPAADRERFRAFPPILFLSVEGHLHDGLGDGMPC
jgi:hypothetical protein